MTLHAASTSDTPSASVPAAKQTAPAYTSPISAFGFCALGDALQSAADSAK